MLSAIRNKSKGWVAYLIVGLITVPFALFGIQDYVSRSANNSIATVDGEDIDINIYYQELNTQQRNLQQQLGAAYTQEIDNAIKQTLLDSMINEKLIENYANSLDIVTLDDEVKSVIELNQAFEVDGEFSQDRYTQLLRLNSYSPAGYELAQSKSLTREQIKRNLSGSAFMSSIQIDQLNDLASQQREVSYIALNTNNYLDQVSVSKNQISDYFNENRSSFIEGKKVKVDFVELTLDVMDEPESPTNDDLQNLYDDNAELYTNSERRRAQHILVESEELAKDLLDQINQGADFAELAKANSEDSSSSEEGGDLGFFEKELMGDEFDEAAFAMNIGDISDVVTTDYGYFHIIKLTDIEAETMQAFNEVEEQLAALYIKNAKEKMLFSSLEEFINLSYEESLDMVADQFGLELQSSDYFGNDSSQYDAKFVASAFSSSVIDDGENSEVMEIDSEKFVVLALSDLQSERERDLSEVEDQIESALKTATAKEVIEGIAESIASALSSGDEQTANSLISENNLEWVSEGWISRASELPYDVASISFSLSKPEEGRHTYSAQSANQLTSLVIDLSGVRVPEEDVNTGIAALYLSQENNEMFVTLIRQLRDNAEIRIFSDLL
ncbi:SurA N-terminal domain-containing protein [Candidatus Pseudothioglobus singularis]|nr:SurA N-terminal domain-containing protein [Candidatus Pseudothioglobus singularis]MDB4846898.1 SurA N-terminal domain-containing protein [Candidatus Pseudothioglobus singularis]